MLERPPAIRAPAAGSERPADDITGLLADWAAGDREALDRLLPPLYQELRRMASARLKRERQGHTLDTGALVHETYLRLVDQRRARLNDRLHFLALAARLMRRVLVDHARRHGYDKRGGGRQRLSLADLDEPAAARPPEVLALDEALGRLARLAPDLARLVELRFFGGLTLEEIAALLGQSARTVSRRFRLARAWLYGELGGTGARP